MQGTWAAVGCVSEAVKPCGCWYDGSLVAAALLFSQKQDEVSMTSPEPSQEHSFLWVPVRSRADLLITICGFVLCVFNSAFSSAFSHQALICLSLESDNS